MAKAVKQKRDDKEQSRQFIKTAREIGADEETSGADEMLGRLAKQKPEPRRTVVEKAKPGLEGRAGRETKEGTN